MLWPLRAISLQTTTLKASAVISAKKDFSYQNQYFHILRAPFKEPGASR
jgi:hypothetical protein